jgi:hypothetical protein
MTTFTDTAPVVDTLAPQLDDATRARIIDLVEIVRSCQGASGAVNPDQVELATVALQQALQVLRPFTVTLPSLATCLCDMEDWLHVGLAMVPTMTHLSTNGLMPVEESQEDAILTVTVTLNYSTHPMLEFIHFRRFEGAPATALRAIYQCDGLMIGDILAATAGYGTESNCIVCFTETLAGGATMPDIMDIFFAAKNALRGKSILQPLMELALAPGCFAELRAASLADLRLIVPCKTVTHEWSHRQGVLALTEFRTVYQDMLTAGLEEARVELRGAYLLFSLAAQGGIHADVYRMAAQFILADRLLRYPYSAHPSDNADAISGQYMFAQCIAKGLLSFHAGKLSCAGAADFITGLAEILADIDALHYRMLTSSSEAAQQLVREHIALTTATLDAENIMQRSLFHQWLFRIAHERVPQTMDWSLLERLDEQEGA